MELKPSESDDFRSNGTQIKNEEKKPLPREFKHATTDFETFLHIVKSSLGSGLLATPDAFKNAGLLLGLIGSAIAVVVITHATSILVKSSQALCCNLQRPFLTYSDTAENAFLFGNIQSVRGYASVARKFVKLFSVITYYGVNTVYVVFIASTLKQILEHQIDTQFNIRWYILAVSIIILPLGVIKLMKLLAPFSAIANVSMLIGLGIVLFEIFSDLPPLDSRPMVAPLAQIPLFFSTILFGLEGIGTVLPVENEMKNPDHFLGWTGVLSFSMVFIGITNAVVGFFGYLRFGEDVCGSISLNLPDDWLSELVKCLIALAILFTYGLQMSVTSEVVWDSVKDYFHKDNSKRAYYYVRGSLVIGTAIVAALVPDLAPIISLFGSIGFSMLGLFCPAVIELVLFYDASKGMGDWRLWKNLLLMFAAIMATVFGTWSSLRDIVSNYQ